MSAGNKAKKQREPRGVAWDELRLRLPVQMRGRFERVLRQTLKRRLRMVEQLHTDTVPDAVRSRAVSEWRRRYTKGQSKAAKKRMNYARLQTDPTYVQIERKYAEQYWTSLPVGTLPAPEGVGAMPFGDVCEAYRLVQPDYKGSSLDALMRDMLKKTYGQVRPADKVREELTRRVREVARTQRFDKGTYGTWRLADFGLKDATSEQEVAELVRSAHMVSEIVYVEYKKHTPFLAAREAIATEHERNAEVAALGEIIQQLTGIQDPARTAATHIATKDAERIDKYLRSFEFALCMAKELLLNPVYGPQYRRAVEIRLRVRENVPQTPMEAYPLARTMRRHVTLHVGPTNSGKTHAALQALASAASGAYLGPLRLLAYEQFEELNRMGCACSLLTGEEAVEVAGARHVSSTVEMANFHTPIDVAVIDEAQMIADRDRGHRWTEALLGIPAQEVHVCCAPHAEQVIAELVALCEDNLSIVRHQRLVPLRPAGRAVRVPEDVQPGDALVVFSRKSVHAVAALVAAHGLKASLVYGALPHDVRHEEARRFDEGETDVVVATDAIGMGMNLPIRRVVFVEQEKFDGSTTRPLRPEEIQQIAGRAGRFGRYDVGFYTSMRRHKEMVRKYRHEVRPIESLPVGIPEDIALVRDATLTECIRQWMALEQPEPFRRIGVSRDLALIGEVEAKLEPERRANNDDKLLVLALATMAFDERDKDLHRLWRQMVDAELRLEEFAFEVPPMPQPGTKLIELEHCYRVCDLLYSYARTFGHPDRLDLLAQRRNDISHAIMAMLAEA